MFVRNGTEMAPISQFVTLKRIMGSEVENRFNLFSAITVNVNPAPGYSTGEVQQVIKEVANQSLPPVMATNMEVYRVKRQHPEVHRLYSSMRSVSC